SGRGRRDERKNAWCRGGPLPVRRGGGVPASSGRGGGSAGPSAPDTGAARDPRVERSRRVILGAVLDELGEVGYGALTIEAVAARAGVGKSTIYRHWPGKLELVEDAFRTLKAPVNVPET